MLVFITGATSGIGKSTAGIFAKNGHDLLITGRRKERLSDLKRELETNYKIKVTDLCFDVRQLSEVEHAIGSLSEENKKIDFLLNNAGLAAGLSAIHDGTLSHWQRRIE